MLISKFIRIAKAGATVDGREITPEQIDQMAANYNPKKYGARIWIEHMRGILPDSVFPAMGDVVELGTEEADGEKYLTARISPTPQMVETNKKGQKVYTSIEMSSNFSDTGEAYLVGLAVTDTPASLGTEMLKFCVENKDKFKAGSELPDTSFSESLEGTVPEFTDEDDTPKENVFSKVKELLGGTKKGNDKRFSQIEASLLALAETMSGLEARLDDLPDNSGAEEQITKLSKSLDDLTAKLSVTRSDDQPPRPKADGTGGNALTDC